MLEKILGRPLFGRADDGAIVPCWWHTQNLDERPGDRYKATGSKAMHGRGWVHFGDGTGRWGGKPLTLRAEWNLRSTSCRIGVRVDDGDRDITFGVALPPVSLWLGVEGLPEWVFRALGVSYDQVRHLPDGCYLMEREIEVSVHHWALWWSFWTPVHLWSAAIPRWRHGNVHLLDTIFGPTKFEKVEIEKQAVLIPMPEKNYRGTVTIERRTWSRPRWPFRFGQLGEEVLFRESLGYDLKMEPGEQIPFPGKGENSWDCDDDALFGQSGDGGVVDAISNAVKSVFRSRRKYGGSIGWKPEPPAAPTVDA
ncbi:MAG: hypothetical protein LC118_07295 [Dehalococcoidia bacterium]|nr:hypothetical protein [Dehalococcoidia bacterium]